MTRETPSTNSPPSLDHWLAINAVPVLDAFCMPVGAGATHARRAIIETVNRGYHRRQRKPRKPTLASVAKQTSKAALDVARYEVKPDGTVVVVTGQPESASPENPWLADLRRAKP